MPRVEAPRPHRGRRKPPSRPNTRGLARRLDQLFHAIRYPDPYARRTALALARIAQNPPGYRLRPELGERIRSCAYGHYVIFFEASPREVTVVRVLHGARDVPAQFGAADENR